MMRLEISLSTIWVILRSRTIVTLPNFATLSNKIRFYKCLKPLGEQLTPFFVTKKLLLTTQNIPYQKQCPLTKISHEQTLMQSCSCSSWQFQPYSEHPVVEVSHQQQLAAFAPVLEWSWDHLRFALERNSLYSTGCWEQRKGNAWRWVSRIFKYCQALVASSETTCFSFNSKRLIKGECNRIWSSS